MGKITELDAVDTFGLVAGLQLHLDANFFPPLESGHKEAITEAFKEHWDGNLNDHDELAERCYLRDSSGLYRYFESFLNEDDDLY
jgi:hypothetical protein